MDIELLLSHPKQMTAITISPVPRDNLGRGAGGRGTQATGQYFAGLETLALATAVGGPGGASPEEGADATDSSSTASFTSAPSLAETHAEAPSGAAIKAKRKRANARQVEILRQAFAQNPFPSSETRRRLAEELGMTPRSVQIWFQNQRQLAKHQSLAQPPPERNNG